MPTALFAESDFDFTLLLLVVPYLGLLAGLAVGLGWLARRAWQAECARVRDAVARHLGLPPGEAAAGPLREQVLALVHARPRRLRGDLAALRPGKRLWLCFLPGRLLFVSGRTGAVAEVTVSSQQPVYLVDPGTFGAARQVAVEGRGGRSRFSFTYLDDLVRVVNLFTQQGAVLKNLKGG